MKTIILLIFFMVGAVGLSQESSIWGSGKNNPVVSKAYLNKNNDTSRSPVINERHSKDYSRGLRPPSLAEKPGVINNPKRITLGAGKTKLNTDGQIANGNSPTFGIDKLRNVNFACSEENPNDFTFEDGYYCSATSQYKVANDLTVAAGQNFNLTNITASIFANGGITNVAVNYYNDASGRPGTLIGSEPSATIVSQTVIGSNFGFNVNELALTVTPFLFIGQSNTSVKYWIQLSVTDAGSTKDVYWVITSSTIKGSSTAQFASGQWTIPDSSVDGVYIWGGDCVSIGGNPINDCFTENPNNFTFENGFKCSSSSLFHVANDLTVPAGENFTINNITASIFANGGITNVAVNYYSDAAGFPGTLMGSQASAVIDSQTVIGSNFGRDVNELKLTVSPFTFMGQSNSSTKYWVELSVTDGGGTKEVYWVSTSTSMKGRPIVARENTLGSPGGGNWYVPDPSMDGVYKWEGNCEPIIGSVPFPSPYCGPLIFRENVEPITLVSVAGINNVSSPLLGRSPSHENFTSIEGAMELGETYPIALEGNTAGNWQNRFVVFIDWNQNGILNDIGEVYEITQTITGSTGTDGQQAIGNISVPNNALTGTTRMRVKKINGTANYLKPCLGASYGQAEDYTIRVTASHTDYVYDNGHWTPADPAGVCTSVDNIQIKNGTAVFSTDISANNIEIDPSATLEIEKVLTIESNLTNNGTLIFISTATGNGELGFVPNGSVITGNATVHRFMKDQRSYRMVSSAVTTSNSIHANWQEGANSNTHNPKPNFGTHITGTKIDQKNGFDGTSTGNPSMFTVNLAAQQFVAIPNTDLKTLTAGEAYLLFVRGDRSINLANNFSSGETVLRATGVLQTGTITQNYATVNAGDFLMFGNPYQSAVDVSSVFMNSTNINTNQYYIYDPSLGDHGAYVTVDLTDGSNTSGSAANQYLQPGQGAQAATIAPGPSSVIFKENDKTPGLDRFTSTNRPMDVKNRLTVQLFTTANLNAGRQMHDSFGMIFGEEQDNGLTPKDAVKPMNFYENLAIDHSGTYLSLERREMPVPAEVYQLYISGYSESDYTLKLTMEGLDATGLYLDDHFTGARTLLKRGETTYSFSVEPGNNLSIAADRFSISAEERLEVESNSLLSEIRLYPNPMNSHTFYVNAPRLNGEQLEVSIRDLSGRRIFNRTLECRGNTVTVPMGSGIASGVYLVTLKHGGESQTLRLIKE